MLGHQQVHVLPCTWFLGKLCRLNWKTGYQCSPNMAVTVPVSTQLFTQLAIDNLLKYRSVCMKVWSTVIKYWFINNDASWHNLLIHYSDVIMSAMASPITSPMSVYSIVHSRCISKKTSKCGEYTGDRGGGGGGGVIFFVGNRALESSWILFLSFYST